MKHGAAKKNGKEKKRNENDIGDVDAKFAVVNITRVDGKQAFVAPTFSICAPWFPTGSLAVNRCFCGFTACALNGQAFVANRLCFRRQLSEKAFGH